MFTHLFTHFLFVQHFAGVACKSCFLLLFTDLFAGFIIIIHSRYYRILFTFSPLFYANIFFNNLYINYFEFNERFSFLNPLMLNVTFRFKTLIHIQFNDAFLRQSVLKETDTVSPNKINIMYITVSRVQ